MLTSLFSTRVFTHRSNFYSSLQPNSSCKLLIYLRQHPKTEAQPIRTLNPHFWNSHPCTLAKQTKRYYYRDEDPNGDLEKQIDNQRRPKIKKSKPLPNPTEGLSKASQFKQIEVDPKTLEWVKSLKLGKMKIRRSPKVALSSIDLSVHGEEEDNPTLQYFRKKNVKLIAQAAETSKLPGDFGIPEVCFIGRSNVGKSSLLNALAGKPISSVSPRPGETTNIRWYKNSNLVIFVDLPGYGFSYAQEDRSGEWMDTVKEYLKNRPSLKRCFVLIDSRQPIKKSDISTMQFLAECEVKYQIVLTKADLVDNVDLAKRVQAARLELDGHKKWADKNVLVSSSMNKAGLAPVRRQIMGHFDREALEIYEAKFEKAKQQAITMQTESVERQKRKELSKQRRQSSLAMRRTGIRIAKRRARKSPSKSPQQQHGSTYL